MTPLRCIIIAGIISIKEVTLAMDVHLSNNAALLSLYVTWLSVFDKALGKCQVIKQNKRFYTCDYRPYCTEDFNSGLDNFNKLS